MAINKIQPAKTEAIEAAKKTLGEYNDYIFTEYRGLTVEQITTLRDKLREHNSILKVIKNNFVESQLGLGVDKHRPIDEERAAEILGQTKNVIKKMVRAREIPYYDKGRKIYFFEDELVKWVEESRVKTWSEEYTRWNPD